MTTPTCRSCLTARVHARRLDEFASVACKRCGAEYTGTAKPPASTIAMQRFAPDTVADTHGPAPIATVTRWEWRPDAKLDMAAVAYAAGSGEIPPSGADEDELSREMREQRRSTRAYHGAARLREMAARARCDGERFAAVVQFAFAERGEIVNQRESRARVACQRFGREGELARWRAAKGRGLSGEMLLIAFGNDLIGAAQDAYEKDEWRWLVPMSRAEVFVVGMAERWERAKAAMGTLAKAGAGQ